MSIRAVQLTITALLLPALPLCAADFTIDPVHTSVLFKVRHFDTTSFYGVFAEVSGIVFPICFGWNGGIPEVSCIGSNARFVFDDHDAGRGVFNKQR